MLKIRYRYFRGDGWHFARDKSGNVRQFEKREQTRQYKRNHLSGAGQVQVASVDGDDWKDI